MRTGKKQKTCENCKRNFIPENKEDKYCENCKVFFEDEI